MNRSNVLKNAVSKNKVVLSSFAVAIILCVIVMIMVPGFGMGAHLNVLLLEICILATLALGQTMVIISGGIDLSVAWNLNCAAVLMTYYSQNSEIPFAALIFLVIGVSALAGLLNGFGVAFLKIPPIIMTLGVNNILQGGILVLLKGASGGNAPQQLVDMVMGNSGGIPNVLIIFIIIVAVALIVLKKTSFGRKLYFVGSNETAALFSGINVRLIKMMVYVVAAIAVSIGALMLTGRLGQSYLGMGDPYTFPTVIAVALGGTALSGGSGGFVGTIGGAMIYVILSGFLSALSLPIAAQQIVNGAILVFAVIIMPNSKRGK